MAFIPTEKFIAKADGHLYKPGDQLMLFGMDASEFDGEIVTITNIRQDGPYGKAYYFATENPKLAEQLNWVYEYRLKRRQ